MPASTGVTVTANPADNTIVGGTVVFTATGSGGTGSYEYYFWLYNGDGTWTIKKPYSTPGNTWTWNTTGLAPGTYQVNAAVRTAGTTTDYDVFQVIPYVLGGGATSVTLTHL